VGTSAAGYAMGDDVELREGAPNDRVVVLIGE
jgi:NOL1/NOP2/fmu family ribosome biogenesis protein